ncbi:hypothetical protein LV85_00079 [Algoriphagus chordae]|uniref:Uncharacterized protein n=1 Tax=Algoriphagus chordae TaxID=237019 RepID=A0A2W7RRC5_9BACT|nr:hypothetical protein LV85_00079 [Algoriphagus chordae]
MDPEKGKERFIKGFTSYCKYWWKLTLPGTIFFAFGIHFLGNRSLSWDFLASGEFYLKFCICLIFYTIMDYYVMYRPNLRHHLGRDREHI